MKQNYFIRLIAKESGDEDLEIDNSIMLGKEWG